LKDGCYSHSHATLTFCGLRFNVFQKFTGNRLGCIIIDCTATLKQFTVKEICSADIVIIPASILEDEEKGKSRPYTEHLSKMAGAKPIPPAPRGYSQREAPTIEGKPREMYPSRHVD
jgi:hypothetical protein